MFDGLAASYVLLLGVVATFNPCGFALLPAYLTVIAVGSADAPVPRPLALRRAAGFGLAMTFGALGVFTAFGLLFGVVSLGLQATILPVVSHATVIIGVAIVVLGAVMMVRGELRGPGLRMQLWAPSSTLWSQVGYGATFAIASLSCTIGLFLVVVTESLAASNPAGAVAPFVIYGLGMGATIVIVSLLAAIAGRGAAMALRHRTVLIMRVGGALMVLAGCYVIAYGLAEILPRYGVDALGEVLLTTGRWQSAVTDALQSWGTPALMVLVGLAGAALVWVFARSGRSGADRSGGTPGDDGPAAGPPQTGASGFSD